MSLEKLWQLQCLKNEYTRIKNEFDNSEVIKKLKEMKELIAKKQNELEKLEAQQKEIEKNARKCNMKEKDLDEKIKAVEEKLYGGKVSNPKELASLEKQLSDLKSEKQKTVEDYIENSVHLEELQEKISSYEKELQENQEYYSSLHSEFRTLKEDCHKKLNSIAADYNKVKTETDSKFLKEYNRLHERFGGSTIARLNRDGRCGGCHVTVPSILQEEAVKSSSLVKCESCGRILFSKK